MASQSLETVRTLADQVGICGVIDCLADLARELADDDPAYTEVADMLADFWEELPVI